MVKHTASIPYCHQNEPRVSPTQIGGGTAFGIPSIYGNPMAGYGYYIENKLQELDSPGEWFYDALSSTSRGG